MICVCGGEDAGAGFHPLRGQAMVDVVGREKAQPYVVVLGVVPGKKILAVGSRVFARAEALWKIGPVLERF